jgi:hypothetical protein
MKLSTLQKYILKEILFSKKPRVDRKIFNKFYSKQKNPPKADIRTNIITKSIERLIDKGLIVGFGEKTQHKLFIDKVRLTPQGRKTAQLLLGRQEQLPFKKRKK